MISMALFPIREVAEMDIDPYCLFLGLFYSRILWSFYFFIFAYSINLTVLFLDFLICIYSHHSIWAFAWYLSR